MPLPLFLGIVAAIAGVTGVGAGIHGGVKMMEANDIMKDAKAQHERNLARFESSNKTTTSTMDSVGKLELEILSSFKTFSDIIEKIQNRPKFKDLKIGDLKLPEYDPAKLKEVSVGAGVLLGGIGGAAVGTAGGFAAAGATTAAVMALGTASTGTAIASLSGVAATNATLAALGGGAIAAGGGGMALGTAVLGGATLGIGLLVGGIIFNFTGKKLSDQADQAQAEMKKAETKINKICAYLSCLNTYATRFRSALIKVNTIYKQHLEQMRSIVNVYGHTDWDEFTYAQKKIVENTVMLVALLYRMCQVELVQQSNSKTELNIINGSEIEKAINDSEKVLSNMIG